MLMRMEHAAIVSFLNGNRPAGEFAARIDQEVMACVRDAERVGVGTILVEDGPTTMVTREGASRLLQALLDGSLSFHAANYLADGLIMSDDFDFADDEVALAIAFVADESREPTSEETRAALAALA
jgi:hypothetical protein